MRRSFAAPSGEYTFKLNNMELPGLDGAVSDAEVVIKQAAGPVRLELQHKTNRWVLCQFELRENRIVLATVSLDDRTVTVTFAIELLQRGPGPVAFAQPNILYVW